MNSHQHVSPGTPAIFTVLSWLQ